MLGLVDEDTDSFNRIMSAFSLPGSTEEEKRFRNLAVQEATKNATMVPFRVMETAFRAFDLVKEMVKEGNPNSVTDAGVGALAIRACIRGAYLNVRINASGLDDKKFAGSLIAAGLEIEKKAEAEEAEILELVGNKIK